MEPHSLLVPAGLKFNVVALKYIAELGVSGVAKWKHTCLPRSL